MTHSTTRRWLAGLAVCALAAGASAGHATAQPAGEPQPSTAAGGSTPQPVPASEMRLVIKDVAILDAAGATLERHHCEWTEPQDDDAPCLRFSGDPQSSYKAIKDAGGDAATVATQVPDLEIDLLTRISERSDGTWLFRTAGTLDGRPHLAGYVCSADGRKCSSWHASSRRGSKRAIRAAAARVKRRSR